MSVSNYQSVSDFIFCQFLIVVFKSLNLFSMITVVAEMKVYDYLKSIKNLLKYIQTFQFWQYEWQQIEFYEIRQSKQKHIFQFTLLKHLQIKQNYQKIIFTLTLKMTTSQSLSSLQSHSKANSFPRLEEIKQQKFDVNSILKSLENEEDLSLRQLQTQFRQLQMALKQSVIEINRMKKQIQLRPTSNNLMENTILMTTAIHLDPNITKLIHIKQNQFGIRNTQHYKQPIINNSSTEPIDVFNQFKQASIVFGHKISQINQALPILLSMIKNVERQKNVQAYQIKQIIQQRFNSIQQQISTMRNDEISEKLYMNQKIDQGNFDTTEKIRQFQAKQTFQLKQVKSRLQQLISKQVFENSLQRVSEQNVKRITKFQQQSVSLVNPQKIKQLQSLIRQTKDNIMKDVVECDVNIKLIYQKIDKSLVNVQFYNKERSSLEKRITVNNNNFEEMYGKVVNLVRSEENHQKRVKALQKQNTDKIKQMADMKKVLKNLHITQQFQKMLAKLDPQRIIELEMKIEQLNAENKDMYKLIAKTNHEIDKILAKFQVAGVLVPNMSRNKQYHLNDLKEIIDEYFIQNRFASKIDKIQNQLNQGKSNVQAVKLLQKKLARLQKQTDYTTVVEQFRKMEEKVNKNLKIFQEKVQQSKQQAQINKSYFQGLRRNISYESKVEQNQTEGNANQQNQPRKQLFSQSVYRRYSYSTDKLGPLTNRQSNSSIRKFVPLTGDSRISIKQTSSNFLKNTVSSTRKNLIKSNDMLMTPNK